jgi:hypothetical protein
MEESGLQKAFRKAVQAAGVSKPATIHSLRHSWATHLLESGVSVRVLQLWMVLQTWTRDLRYHPHVHYLVPGGGLADDGRTWMRAKTDFLVHVKPLAALFQAKLRAALRQTALWSEIPAAAWQQPWVVDCRPVGTARAALKYLAPYIFRVALSNNRIVRVADGQVMFGYTVGESGQTACCTLAGQEFLRRFLQHILPKGFVKVRYYGLFRLGMRRRLTRLRGQLQLLQQLAASAQPAPAISDSSTRVMSCPSCGQAMQLERVLLPHNRGPPKCVGQHGRPILGRCKRRVAWLAVGKPPSARPGTVLTAMHLCAAGCAQRVSVLLNAAHSPPRGHGQHMCGQLKPLTTVDQHSSSYFPTPPPR